MRVELQWNAERRRVEKHFVLQLELEDQLRAEEQSACGHICKQIDIVAMMRVLCRSFDRGCNANDRDGVGSHLAVSCTTRSRGLLTFDITPQVSVGAVGPQVIIGFRTDFLRGRLN